MNDRFDAPTYVIGGVLSGASLTSALVSSQLGRLTGRFSEMTLLRCAFLLYTAGLTLVAVTPTLLLLLLLIPLVLFGVAQGINLPNVFSLLNAHAPNENRGAYLATAIIALVASLLAFVAVR